MNGQNATAGGIRTGYKIESELAASVQKTIQPGPQGPQREKEISNELAVLSKNIEFAHEQFAILRNMLAPVIHIIDGCAVEDEKEEAPARTELGQQIRAASDSLSNLSALIIDTKNRLEI